MKKTTVPLFLSILLLTTTGLAEPLRMVRLRCEAMREAVGVANPRPRFTWAFEGDEDSRATKAQVRVDGWTGESDDLFSLVYAGPSLSAGRPHVWQARLVDATGKGVTPWSPEERFVLALQNAGDWGGAKWIGENVDGAPRFGDGALSLRFKPLKGETEVFLRARPDGTGGASFRVGKGLPVGTWHDLRFVAQGARVEALVDGRSIGVREGVPPNGTFGLACGKEEEGRVRRLAWAGPDGKEVLWDGFTGHRQAAFFRTERDGDGLVVRNRRYLHTGLQPKNCPRFRKTFVLKAGKIAWATASVCGKGFCELWLNGAKADPRRVLAPANLGRKGLAFDTHDVTALLKGGERNTVGLWLAPGYSDDFSQYGTMWLRPKRVLLHLAVGYADGTVETVVTDGSWEWSAKSPIAYASLYHGERFDAALDDPAWATPDGKTTLWAPAKVLPDDCGPLRANAAPPVRLAEPLSPVRLVEPRKGVFVADFGQNRAGVVEIRAKGPKGTKIVLRTSELVDKNGAIDPWTNRNAESRDEFTLAGTGAVERYCPRFTYHGFRYVEITGWPGRPTPADLTAWAVHADLERTASFTCSDDTLNRLFRAATWSMLSNFMNNPTDCPMRDERTPCAMDSQAYEDAAAQFFDMQQYYEKWLDDSGAGGPNPDWSGDAQTLVLRQWRHYGDRRALAGRYDDLKRAVDRVAERYPDGFCKDGFGDWVAPNDGTWAGYHNDVALVNTAIYAQMIANVVEAAKALGNGKDAAEYAAKFEAQRQVFERRFRNRGEATYGDRSQTTSVLPLAFGLVPESDRGAVLDALAERLSGKDRFRFDTGIFGTRYMGEVLLDAGRDDLFFRLFTQREFPSFGFMFDRGATTLWEQWTFRGGMNSHNHAMFAGGASCLLSHLAGIRPARPGYRELLVKPAFPKGLSFLRAERLTPFGRVVVDWRREGDLIRLNLTTPPYVKVRTILPKNVLTGPRFVRGDEAIAFAAGLQQRADAMKKAVLSSPSDCSAAKGVRHYVSAEGDDAKDGLSERTAVRTLAAVNRWALKKGDAVLFRRGDLFRGRLAAQPGVTYSAYGTGEKPTICSSRRNYADPALWEQTDVPTVWRCREKVKLAGVITFDHDPQIVGKYDVKVGRMRFAKKGVKAPAHLTEDLDFWNGVSDGALYLRVSAGNPGRVFGRIEIGEHDNAISVRGNGVTVDNLHVTLAGSHGVGAGTVKNLEVRNCVFDWIGGSLLVPEGVRRGPVRYGNAVEVYGGCDGYRVHDCWMYQIYDTGITHQCHHAKDTVVVQANVEYARNLIECCFWSIEYYNAFNKRGETRNVRVHDNFCRFGGYGWGCPGRATGTPMFSIDDRPDVTENYVNEGNILERSLGALVNNFGRHASPPGFVFRRNVYVQPRGWTFATIGDRSPRASPFDERAADVIRETFGETDGTFVYLPEEKKDLSAFSALVGEASLSVTSPGREKPWKGK